MNRLIAELQRLYFLRDQPWRTRKSGDGGGPAHSAEGVATPEIVAQSLAGEASAVLDLVGANGRARAMAVDFARAADWEQAARLYRGVQEDLDLPAPAVSVSGSDGYRLWFSLAEPVPVAQASGFLHALHRQYLADIPLAHLQFHPDAGGPASTAERLLDLAPALHKATGKWSAFVDPALGSMFIEEPWLDMAPNLDKQADMLAGCASMQTGDLLRALDILQPHAEPAGSPAERAARVPSEGAGQPGVQAGRPRAKLDVGSHFSDPQSFLLAVMNDPSASAGQRIKAAKALLPYFGKSRA